MDDLVIALPPRPDPADAHHAGEALSDAALGQLIGALASRPGPVPKYIYPSAGTLYPVQAYLVLRRALGGLPAGAYYHDPDAHALAPVSTATPAAPDGSAPHALLVLVAQRAAIEPIYGDEATRFCFLEAGYMAEALASSGSGLRLRDAGDPAGCAELAGALGLDAGHLPVVCWDVAAPKDEVLF